MNALSRRNILRSSAVVPAIAVGGLTGQLVTCQNGKIVVDPAVINAIQQDVAIACNFIPSAETIAVLIAMSFPALSGATTIALPVLQQISAILCAAPPTPGATTAAAGVTAGNVAVHGWIIQNGKLVYA